MVFQSTMPGQEGTIDVEAIRALNVVGEIGGLNSSLVEFALEHGLTCTELPAKSEDCVELILVGEEVQISVLGRSVPADTRGTLALPPAGATQTELVATVNGARTARNRELLDEIVDFLKIRHCIYSHAEVDGILEAMPLLRRYADCDGTFGSWALVFRDHYVENSVGFLHAFEEAGMDPQWIYALAKGDRTSHRDRVHAWFLHRGYRSAVLDNSVINGTASDEEVQYAQEVGADVNEFIRAAHRAGRRVLIIDDGGLIAQGKAGGTSDWERADAAIELTVSGLKRVSGARLQIPVFNMARSELKTHLSYNEIADSCLRRIRALLGGQKFLGRRIVCLGFGTLGARLARGLRSAGSRVVVVDTDALALVRAAEEGFETARSLRAALRMGTPFLVTGSTGEEAIVADDIESLPDGVHLAGLATKDFSFFSQNHGNLPSRPVGDCGTEFALPNGSRIVLLGDGRSLNLFDFEGIPNQGYDAYRAGTFILAKAICSSLWTMPPGVHVTEVDDLISSSGLYGHHYDTYIADCQDTDAARDQAVSAAGRQ